MTERKGLRVDLENHFACEAWIDALMKNPGYPRIETDKATGRPVLHWQPNAVMPFKVAESSLDLGEGRLAAMDQAGIDIAVLSLVAPGAEALDPAVGTRVARASNDLLAEAVSRYPQRFRGYASLAPKDAVSAVAELERAVKDLGFKGWNTHSNFGDSYLDERRYWPILAKAEELDVPIYLHPTVPSIEEFRVYGQGLAGASFGFGAETAMVMMRLIFSGAFDAFPKLKIILGHYAEGLPFMLDRVDRPYVQGHVKTDPKLAPELRRMPSEYLRENMYASTSGNYSPDAFNCTKSALGIDRMVIGTDYSYEDMDACMQFLESQNVTDEDRMWLYEGTARAKGAGGHRVGPRPVTGSSERSVRADDCRP